MVEGLRLGQLVHSTAGRDKDRVFLIVALSGDSFAYLADGDLRKINNPKKKNIKHLQATKLVADTIADKLKNGEAVNNAEIRKAIADLISAKVDTAGQGG
ncbi:KOW domain-containing RNA-binding protein [Zhaonella formicivorans]|jgi:ribosomal protein L14E/L6E/L27E|uniref:KOW domain-containing RNA-binding protein n=1 Tax=Zhaonella formicivorans TaxID=2528593 RepID=UPI0010E10059|nr:KOW domain-containing RNA-binding protein [Zhaonella formicivorans]